MIRECPLPTSCRLSQSTHKFGFAPGHHLTLRSATPEACMPLHRPPTPKLPFHQIAGHRIGLFPPEVAVLPASKVQPLERGSCQPLSDRVSACKCTQPRRFD